MTNDTIKALIDIGLVRESCIRDADDATLSAVELFAHRYKKAGSFKSVRSTVGASLIRHEVLTPELVENIIIASAKHATKQFDGSDTMAERCAAMLGSVAPAELEQLLRSKALSAAVILRLLRESDMPILRGVHDVKKMISVFVPGGSNIINWGITDIIEFEAVQRSILGWTARPQEYFGEKHPLMRAMRVTESLLKKKQQAAVVVPANDRRPFITQLEAIWQHYAQQSKLFRDIESESPISEDVRKKNVTRVNDHQARRLSAGTLEYPQHRFIDIYGRYNHSEMDPLMLALIARTVGWYVDNHHASLFTKVRMVPDRNGVMDKQNDNVPWAALALYPQMELLKVQGGAFRESMRGANRMFLTHSDAKDASTQGSIPIVGLAVWKNPYKLQYSYPYAVLCADFDQKDRFRKRDRKWKEKDQSASFAGTIDETLRALRAVENLEIARANGVPLKVGIDQRWRPSSPTPDKSPWRGGAQNTFSSLAGAQNG